MNRSIADLRKDYVQAALDEASAGADPFALFGRWFDEAVKAEQPEPNAMTLATVGADQRPSARVVLLKGIDEQGPVFFTNYDSSKGRQLAANPAAALVFFWPVLERQVRIEGHVSPIDTAQSDHYFASRPLESRYAAIASPQSEPVASRDWLQARMQALQQRADPSPARPAHWGGYRLRADCFEFWQGRRSRLHDRIRFRLIGTNWQRDRLAP